MKALTKPLNPITPNDIAIPRADSNWLVVNDEKIHFIDKGKGPVLVLIHGLGADLSRWQNNIDELAKHHRVIAVDLLGFGQSSKPNLEFRGQTFVDQISSMLIQLNIQLATLIGNSMGGWISLLLAEQYPELIKALVLVAPAFVFGLPPGVGASQLVAGASPQTLEAMESYLERVYHRSPAEGNKLYIEQALKEKIAKRDHNTITAIARSLAKQQDSFDEVRLRQLAINTLIIHGDNDGIVPIDASRKLVSLLPNATLEIIESAGHWPQLEQPRAFIKALHNLPELF